MENYGSAKFVDNKVVLRLKDRICETPEELLTSTLFLDVVRRYIKYLKKKESSLLGVFGKEQAKIVNSDIRKLIEVFRVLEKMGLASVPKLLEDVDSYIKNPNL